MMIMTPCSKQGLGRGALDPAPVTSREVVSTSSGGIMPVSTSTGMIVNPRTEVRSTNWSLCPNQREHVSVGPDHSQRRQQVVSPSSGHIISEGATIFMDMTGNYVRCPRLADGFVI